MTDKTTEERWAEIQKQLAIPFGAKQLEWRIGRCGESNATPWATALVYITARAPMYRLDDVVGIGNWKNAFRAGPAGGVLCGLSLRLDSESPWVTKWDGADNTGIESVKGGLSGSAKRAGAQWGIGRYLYDVEGSYCTCSSTKKDDWKYQPAKTNGKAEWQNHRAFWWTPPSLPDWALPDIPEKTNLPDDAVDKIVQEIRDCETEAMVRATYKKHSVEIDKIGAADQVTTECRARIEEIGGQS